MIKQSALFISVFTSLFFVACAQTKSTTTSSGIPSLKETFKTDFAIGTAMDATQIEVKDPKADALIRQQFNAVTPENIMKAEVIHPQWDKYDFNLADKLVAYAKKN
ncbi:MAG TPA: endo-1,4-beta-xylanase, partial [Flavisolibacter sp.]